MNFSDNNNSVPPGQLRVMQLIAGAIVSGLVIFLSIVLFIVFVQNDGRGNAPAESLPMVSFIAAGMLVMNGVMAIFLPGLMTRNAQREIVSGARQRPNETDPAVIATDAGKLLAVRQTTLIVTLALFEAPAFLGCVGFLLEAQVWGLAVVAGALALMLLNFPTENRVRAWLDRQTEALADLRRWQ